MSIERDEEGYLVDLNDWTTNLAEGLARDEGIQLTENHWQIVDFLREYYDEHQIAPAVWVMTKAIGKKYGRVKGRIKYLYELFPSGPARQACKIAGLPKPNGCI